ncbi:MAG: serine/threonine-protein phosphatase [Lachnospiraceae bacterium]|nr:serine/threonine-protein phosphatase [Lachnospiraceae bacterium]
MPPAQILSDVNRQRCEHNTSGLFVTVWMAILQISTGKGMAAQFDDITMLCLKYYGKE